MYMTETSFPEQFCAGNIGNIMMGSLKPKRTDAEPDY